MNCATTFVVTPSHAPVLSSFVITHSHEEAAREWVARERDERLLRKLTEPAGVLLLVHEHVLPRLVPDVDRAFRVSLNVNEETMYDIEITPERAELLRDDKDPEFMFFGETTRVYEGGVARRLVLLERRASEPSELYALLVEQENEMEVCGTRLMPVEIETVTVREVVPLRNRLMSSHGILANRLIDRFPSIL